MMLSVIILDNGEPKVTQLTFENLYSELKDIQGSELLIKDNWFNLDGIKNKFVCFVEADCLVSAGYFKKQLEEFQDITSRSLAMMSSATAVNYWDNKIYGYTSGLEFMGLRPLQRPKSTRPFMVQVAYIPGSIIRLTMLKACLGKQAIPTHLIDLSRFICMAFWERSAKSKRNGHEVLVNPNVTYLTTEDYVNDIYKQEFEIQSDVINLFNRSMV